MNRHLMRIRDCQHQIIQRQIGPGIHARPDPVLQTAQFAMPAAIALRPRFQPTRLALQDDHVIDELH
jgi:hypothetical protein